MDPEYWHSKWRHNDLGFNQSEPNVLLQKFLASIHLKGKKVLVPLCGKSIDMLYLLDQGYAVIGVELNLVACEALFHEHHLHAQKITIPSFTVLAKSEKNMTLFCGNFFDITPQHLGHIDLVYDRAALIALPIPLRLQYAQHMLTLINNDSHMLLITTLFDQIQMQGPPFSVDEEEIRTLYSPELRVKQIFDRPISRIPEHLHKKGLQTAREQAYWLKKEA